LEAPPFLAMCKFLAFRALGDVDTAERPFFPEPRWTSKNCVEA